MGGSIVVKETVSIKEMTRSGNMNPTHDVHLFSPSPKSSDKFLKDNLL